MFDIKNAASVVVNETESISQISNCTKKDLNEAYIMLDNIYMKLTAESVPGDSAPEAKCLLDEVKIIHDLTARIVDISRRLSEIL